MFTLRIETDNAAFGDEDEAARNEESARILRDAADKIEQGYESGKLFDVNGNSVGDFSF